MCFNWTRGYLPDTWSRFVLEFKLSTLLVVLEIKVGPLLYQKEYSPATHKTLGLPFLYIGPFSRGFNEETRIVRDYFILIRETEPFTDSTSVD
jgi:hypothetical protein